MPLYDYRCSNPGCDQFEVEFELIVPMAARHEQFCDTCNKQLEKLDRPTHQYKPFHNYFDEGLGVEITGRDHRRRVMRDLQMDYRDHMSIGDRTARLDKCNEQRKERARRGPQP